MSMYSLGDQGRGELLHLPETGIGFQLVEGTFWGDRKKFLVFNADLAIDLSSLNLDFTADPDVVQRNEARIVAEIRAVYTTVIAAPGPHSFRLLSGRVETASSPVGPVLAARPSSLVKHVTLAASRTFCRFSAFQPDRRVDPVTGDVAAGTYAAPQSESPFVPTGFVAVGRFALPNNVPASYRYTLRAPAGTRVSFGTVTPAFGQSGGGVEAFFDSLVVNQAPRVAPVKIPDE